MATITKQTIYLDLTPGRVFPVLHVSQGDTGLEALEFKLVQNGMVFNIPAAVTDIQINGTTPLGVFSYNHASGVDWSGNTVTAAVTQTMTEEAGMVVAELVLLDSAMHSIGSLNFLLSVEPSPYTVAHVSTSDMASISASLNEAQQNFLMSKSWAVGDTGLRDGEATNNSKYWAGVAEDEKELAAQYGSRLKAQVDTNSTRITQEVNDRSAAVSSEASTRSAAVSSLQSQINQYVKPSTQQPDEVVNARVGADGTTYSTLGNAVREQITDLKSAFDFVTYTGEKIITNFNQGAPSFPGKSDRCTTGYCYCHVGDVISCTGIPVGMKFAVGDERYDSGSSEGYDSGWKTADFQYTVRAEGNYACNIAKSNGTDAITPSEITGFSVTFSDKSSNVYKNKNAINALNSVVDGLNVSQINSSVHKNFIGRNVGEKYPIDIKKGEKYTVSTADGQNFPVSFRIRYYDENDTFINADDIPAGVNQCTITLAHENVKFVDLHESPQTVIQLEIGDTKTSFEPYYKDVLECNNILWAKDISRKGYFVIDKNEMVNGSFDENGYAYFLNRCHSRDIFIPAHKGDRVIASTPDNDGSVTVAVTEDPLGAGYIYTCGWQQAIDMVNENEGYYIFFGKTTTELFNGTFKVIPNIYTNNYENEVFTSEIEATIDSVRECQTEPSITFLLCTDIHYGVSENGDPYLLDRSTVNMKAVIDSVRTDFIVCLGDISEGDSVNTEAYSIKVNNTLRNLGIPYLLAIGNHDDNRYRSGSTFTADDMYKYYDSFVHNKAVFNEDTNGRDYYIDCDIYKTRFIIIDSNTVGAYGFASETVTWFQNNALNTPNDYLAVVLVHESSVPSQNYNNSTLRNGTAITSAITDYLKSGKPIIQFYGHSHCDVSFDDPFLSIGTNCLKFENTNGDPAKWPSGAVKPSRVAGTITEDCWDMVVLRPLSRKVDCVRFGAGNNRSFTY